MSSADTSKSDIGLRLAASLVASPHAHGGNSVSQTMLRVKMALVPATLFGFWLFGWQSFFLLSLIHILCCAKRAPVAAVASKSVRPRRCS